MLFQKRQDFSPSQTGNALGSTITFEITREFHIESIFIVLNYTPTAAMATNNADNAQAILKKVTLQVSDGARTRNVVDLSGPALLELARQWQGGLDRLTAAAIDTDGTAALQITYPIWFSHPQISDPVGSTLLLPAPRFNSNPVLTLQFASQADMDLNATPTFAVAAGISARLIINRRQVTSPKWVTLDSELYEQVVSYPTTGNNQLHELSIPGSITGILFRDYTSNAARGSIQVANGENRLQLLGTVMRRFRMEDLQIENDMSKFLYPATWVNFTASYYLDFLTDKVGEASGDMGSVLDTNILQTSGARVQLLQDITGGATVQRKYVTHKVYGNLSQLKFGGGQ